MDQPKQQTTTKQYQKSTKEEKPKNKKLEILNPWSTIP